MASSPKLPPAMFAGFAPTAASTAAPASVDQLFGPQPVTAKAPKATKPPKAAKASGQGAPARQAAGVHGSSLAAKPTRQPHPTKPGRDTLGRLMPGATLPGAAAPFTKATTRARRSVASTMQNNA